MRNSGVVAGVILALVLHWPVASAQADSASLPRLSGATFLIGDPTTDITLTSGQDTSTVRQAGGEWYTSPSISADGSVIATAFHYLGAIAASCIAPLLPTPFGTIDGQCINKPHSPTVSLRSLPTEPP